MEKGFVVWLTGLPASGKTTVGRKLAEILRSKGYKVEVLDGDEVRKGLSSDLGFTKEDREKHLKRVIWVSKLLKKHGIIVVDCFVSPYRYIRDYARKEIGDFVEVYVKCSLETCIKRDPKGLYKKALAGEIKHFTGIDDPYEEPLSPDVVVDTEKQSVEENAKAILKVLVEKGYLPSSVLEGV